MAIVWYNTVMDRIYKFNQDSVYSCRYLVVWCSKYRRKVLVDAIEARLRELVHKICEENAVDIITLEIMPNNVKLLLDVEPQQNIHKIIKKIKGTTSHSLRDEFKELTTKLPTLWSNSYLLSTVGEVQENIIQQYIESQKTSQRK